MELKCLKWLDIVDFRNLIIHGYDVIRDSDVWKIIQTDLPSLRQTVTTLIAEPPSPADTLPRSNGANEVPP
jgi:uncharacterized protein with HEPN domain